MNMKTIKVMTYNIRHGQGMDGKVDLARIARVVDDIMMDHH
jgi:endonuclease/exonuclease/phosphatase family metal-dependent hydrolase